MKYLTDFCKTVETGMDPRPFISFSSGIAKERVPGRSY